MPVPPTDDPDAADPAAPLAAGDFSAWLRGARLAVRAEAASDVPCDGCSACCTSSQFVLIGPEETDTLAHIPAELLFPAPGRPDHVLLGYDEQGHCPMLENGLCSIYAHRPVTCRSYDCRVFAATGMWVDDDKPDIVDRVERWEFGLETPTDRVEQEAVREAAMYLRERRGELTEISLPISSTQLAALAIEVSGCFVARAPDGTARVVADPPPRRVRDAADHYLRGRAAPA